MIPWLLKGLDMNPWLVKGLDGPASGGLLELLDPGNVQGLLEHVVTH